MSVPYRRIGRIAGTHGTSGEVVVSLAEHVSEDDIRSLSGVWIVPPLPSGATMRALGEMRSSSRGLLLRIDGLDTLGEAHSARGRFLLARTDELTEPPRTTESTVGYRVIDVDHGNLGSVASVIVTGANDVLVVHGEQYKEVLLPVIPDVILAIDDAQRCISVRLLPGLIEGLG